MKKYVAIESAKPIRGRYEFNVYRIKYNELIFVGTGEMCYARTRGELSEVMKLLANQGEIPKKYANKYYECDKPSNIKITYKVPLNQG